MSVLEQIRKLDQQKAELLLTAKAEALSNADKAIKELAELGFHYRLVSDATAPVSTGGGRRTGIRDQVLSAIRKANAINRAQLLEAMQGKGDKSAEQSISNALAALKKAGTITAEDGVYKVT